MMALSGRRWVIIVAIALVAVAAWPFLGAQRANATYAYYAPVQPDYVYRDKTIAFYEKRMLQDSQDQISARILASQYQSEADPLELLRQVRFVLSVSLILVYMDCPNGSWNVDYHAAGANGLLSKQSSITELAVGLRSALRSGCFTDPRCAA